MAGMTSSPVFFLMTKRHLPADGNSVPVKSMLSCLSMDSDVQPSESEIEGPVVWGVGWRDCGVRRARCLSPCSGEGRSGSVTVLRTGVGFTPHKVSMRCARQFSPVFGLVRRHLSRSKVVFLRMYSRTLRSRRVTRSQRAVELHKLRALPVVRPRWAPPRRTSRHYGPARPCPPPARCSRPGIPRRPCSAGPLQQVSGTGQAEAGPGRFCGAGRGCVGAGGARLPPFGGESDP